MILLLTVGAITLLSIPKVQTIIAKKIMSSLNEKYNTNISISKATFSIFGKVLLKDVLILDHHKKPLITAEEISTSIIDFKKILDDKLELSTITLENAKLNMCFYKGETNDNLEQFIDSFDSNKKSEKPFIFTIEDTYIDNLDYTLNNYNKKESLDFSATNIGAYIQDFKIKGADIDAKIRGAYFIDNRKINITKLSTDFSYSKKKINLRNTSLNTNEGTSIKGDIIFFSKNKKYSDFLNKVKLKSTLKFSYIAAKDLKKFYDGFGGSDIFKFDTKLSGTLNKILLKNFKMQSKNGMEIYGNFDFSNSFSNKSKFQFNGEFTKMKTSYEMLQKLLPKTISKNNSHLFNKLGNFTTVGIVELRPNYIDANVEIKSRLGSSEADLHLTKLSNIYKAKYEGSITLNKLNLGKLLNKKTIGKVSLKAYVDGKGLLPEKITSTLKGEITKFEFEKYEYKNIEINGRLDRKKYDGIVSINDENAVMNFEGVADFYSKVNNFDFDLSIEKLDLKKTNLFTRDSIALVSGNIKLNLKGNSFDEIIGETSINDISYTNEKEKIELKNFNFRSKKENNIRTLNFDSDKLINGVAKGNFLYKEIIPITKNALFSVYSNYTPMKVKNNQFVDFDIQINKEIIEILFKDIKITKKAYIKGFIDTNEKLVRLSAQTPKIIAYETEIDSLNLNLNNKNIKYHTSLFIKKIKDKRYVLHDFKILNRTKNDTLFFNSTFSGGKKKNEDFNLNLFYTFDQINQSTLGFNKSTFFVKGRDWLINPERNKNNKVSYNPISKKIHISPILITDGKKQNVRVHGILSDSINDVNLNFTKLNMKDITPSIDDLKLEGILNGQINIKDKENTTGNFTITDLIINDVSQGILKAKFKTDNSYKKYDVDFSMRDYDFDNIKATGKIDFSTKKPLMFLDVKLKEFELDGYKNMGGSAITNIRGIATGNFKANGIIYNPEFSGYLKFNKTGLSIPYLNINVKIEEESKIIMKNKSFIMNNIKLQDLSYDTTGRMSGSIKHRDFRDWFLDLKLKSKNLLALNTRESEEEYYYGTGFLNGEATIKGPTSSLKIDVKGKTNKNTVFVIPLKEVTFADKYKLIKFVEPKKEKKKKKKIKGNGLSFTMNLDVTNDALAKVVIDKVNRNELEGRGNGNIDISVTPGGSFKMNGGLKITNGFYNFRYTGISKKFEVQDGGTISWDGDPLKTELDITALFKARANPSQLLDNIVSNRKIPVNLYTHITGELFDSHQEFDIKIPNADSSVSSELEFRFENDNNSKMLNFASLLLGNTFYNNEATGNFASNVATSTASDVLSNIISDVMNSEDSKLKLNVGYTQADRNEIKEISYDDQVDVSVEGQLSDRVIFNGKLGVPVGTSNIQSSIVGEANLDVLLNPSGSLRWNIFNKPNDIQYSIEEQGYTQGTGISYQVNFNNFSELLDKIFGRKEDEGEGEDEGEDEDEDENNKKNKQKTNATEKN